MSAGKMTRAAAAAMPELLTTEELAGHLKICKKTIYEKTRSGEIPVEIDLPGIRRYVLADVVAALKTLSPAPVYRGPAKRPEGVSEILAELTAQRKAARAAMRAGKEAAR